MEVEERERTTYLRRAVVNLSLMCASAHGQVTILGLLYALKQLRSIAIKSVWTSSLPQCMILSVFSVIGMR